MKFLFNQGYKTINWMLVCIFVLSIALVSISSVLAQSDSGSNAKVDTSINNTQKSLFSEAKKIAKNDDNTFFSVLMISLVVIIVVIAIWLSFKPDEQDKLREKKKRDAESLNKVN